MLNSHIWLVTTMVLGKVQFQLAIIAPRIDLIGYNTATKLGESSISLVNCAPTLCDKKKIMGVGIKTKQDSCRQ